MTNEPYQVGDEFAALYAAIDRAEAQSEAYDRNVSKVIDSLESAKEQVAAIVVNRPSEDESVVASVDADHRLRELWIKPGACASYTPEALARQISQAISAATKEAALRRNNVPVNVDAETAEALAPYIAEAERAEQERRIGA